jgi:tetratricopeptide (TPR) repeat protein
MPPRPRRSSSPPPRRSSSPPRREGAGPKSWGGVARRGAGNVRDGGPPQTASKAWRDAAGLSDQAPPAWEPEQWVEDKPERAAAGRPKGVRQEAGKAVSRGAKGRRQDDRKRPQQAGAAPQKVAKAVAGGKRAGSRQRLADAARAYEEEHYRDARRMLAPLVERDPESAAARELYGLTLYRLGKWKEAIVELKAFERLTGTLEQHPVLADCYRALKRWPKVEELWDELRHASPGADLVNEGRIVAAGALADRGNLKGAIALLEKAPDTKRPKARHLRLWYALADLRERAGDVPGARELFERVVQNDPTLTDAPERLSSLGH